MYGNCVGCGKPTDEIDLHGGGDPRCIPCKKAKLGGREPREYTEKEVRAAVLDHIWGMIAYWRDEERRPTVVGKMEGLAFSIMSMLDGSAVGLPNFIVAPDAHPDDKEYSKKHQEDWYPHQTGKTLDSIKCDIGGSLHDEFHKHRPKSWPEEPRDEFGPRKKQISTSDLMEAHSLIEDLNATMRAFKERVWLSLKAYVAQSSHRYHSGLFGGTLLLVGSTAGRVLVTLRRGNEDVTFIGGEAEVDTGFGIQSIHTSRVFMEAMVSTVICNWDPDKLKQDDGLRIG